MLDRNRGGAYLAVLVIGAAMFGIFLFLTYYLQTILGYSPVITGVAFLPTIAMIMLFAQISNIVLMPRIGPKPLVGFGMLIAAAGMAWLTRIGVHSGYVSAVLGPLLVTGAGIGLSMPPSMNTGTFGVAGTDAGVASATLNVGQQLGGSIGTALLNTIATSAAAVYFTSHLTPALAASPSSRAAAPGRRGGARLHDRILVDGGHLRRRRHRLRDLAAPGPAGPSGRGRPRRRPGTGTGVRAGPGRHRRLTPSQSRELLTARHRA